MRRNITIKTLLLLSLFVTGSAWAEWRKTGESNDAVFYIDPATIRKGGNLRKVWTMTNYTERQKSGILSTRQREEYDCKNERSRGLSQTQYAEANLGGQTINDLGEDSRGWRDIAPDTVGANILATVCAQ